MLKNRLRIIYLSFNPSQVPCKNSKKDIGKLPSKDFLEKKTHFGNKSL